MSNKQRQRLDVDARRSQLLGVGSELFASRPYDDVWIDHVAERAGVSRGLLYHYFGSKRAFLYAVIERETQQILAATQPDLSLPPGLRLRASVDGYLDYVAAHPHGYRAMFRGAVSADAQVRGLIDANLSRQEARILQAAFGGQHTEQQRLAIHGWVALLISIALDWLDRPAVDQASIADLAVRALDALLAAASTEA